MPASAAGRIPWGTHDRLLPPGQADVARKRVPETRFVLLPGCGHVSMTDDSPPVARVLLEGSTVPVPEGSTAPAPAPAVAKDG